MKLIGMRFQGIGPYADAFSIDFAALNRSHIFLIEGETGAGKSTILDCVSFALYGTVSSDAGGKEGKEVKDRLRSRFLGTRSVRSYVDLIFAVNDTYYRVRREPKYERAKQRGEGTTPVNASGKLWQLNSGVQALVDAVAAGQECDGTADRYFAYAEKPGNAKNLTAKASDTSIRVRQLLGLSREQFSKTVMLAQGKFADFLRAMPEERTQLIKELFAAEGYERIQNKLDEMRKAQDAVVKTQRAELCRVIGEAKANAEAIEQALSPYGSGQVGQGGDASGVGASEGVATADAVDVAGSDAGGAVEATDVDRSACDKVAIDEPDQQASQTWCLNGSDIAEPAMTVAQISHQLHAQLDATERNSKALCAASEAALQQSKKMMDQAQRKLSEAQRLQETAEQLEQCFTQQTALQQQRQAIESVQHRLARSEQAEPVIHVGDEVAALLRQCDDQKKIAEQAEQDLQSMPSAEELSEQHGEAVRLTAQRPVAETKLQMLQQRMQRLHDAVEAEQHASQSEDHRATQEQSYATAKQRLQDLGDESSVSAQLDEAIRQEERGKTLNDQLAAAQSKAEHAEKRQAYELAIVEQQDAVRQAEEHQRQADAEYQEAKQAFFTAEAAKYAQQLQDGCACPVCGSVEHPSPAQVPADVPSEQRLEDLEQTALQASHAVEQARNEVRVAQIAMASEREQSDDLTVEDAQAAVEAIAQQLKQLGQLSEHRRQLEQQLQDIREATQQSRQEEQRLNECVAQAKADQQIAQKARELCGEDTEELLKQQEQEVREKLDECDQQQQRADQIAEAMKQRDYFEQQHAQAQAKLRTLDEQLHDKQQRLDHLLKEQSFPKIEDAREALLGEQERQTLTAQVHHYEESVAVNHSERRRCQQELEQRLDTDTARQLLGDHMPLDAQTDEQYQSVIQVIRRLDVTAIDQQCEEYRHANEQAIRAEEVARNLEQNRTLRRQQLEQALQQWTESSKKFVPLRDMAMLAKGQIADQEANGLTLITYAVTERFKDVLARANEILKDIKGGVFELRLGDHEGGKTSKTGLPISVFDRRSELETNASTLSGGETFFVSLALALALADVIQAENGGISMETLFIDEGFGSLSEEYLDDVMAVLRQISRHRDIGIISHVGRLKDQIAERITVSRISEDSASRLTVVV